ncbi:hypothetical protein L596_015104 [Steinernema carpocapsae]|uniref:Peroxisome assembly protein 12 n=1 Tax=Steinernema carpocapsae TaxID=34508 RepID=A0A4U5NDZ8_STECR|nr:hypothetical protein L596_015104 [Steinernema carpocapsae]
MASTTGNSALHGAFLSQNQQNQVGTQPSIFDLLAQESLMGSLKPSLKHLVNFLAFAYPGRFRHCNAYFEELYTSFSFLMENYFLSKYGATFAENFYSMKRISTETEKPVSEWRERAKTLAIVVVLPYIRDKIDKYHEKINRVIESIPPSSNEPFKFKLYRLFAKVYPWIKSFFGVWGIVLQLGYILSRSRIHSPALWFAKAYLEKLTPADLEAFGSIPAYLQQTGFFNRIWRILLSIPGLMSRLFAYGLFFIQFLDYFYSSDLSKQFSANSIRSSVPPQPHKKLQESSVLMLETNKCPLCLKQREVDTALSVSGYVFCYKCIYDYLRREHSCPVTQIPARTTHLVRLYANSR